MKLFQVSPLGVDISNAEIADGAITNAKVNAAAAIALTKLAALTSAQIIVGNGSNVPTAMAMSGDVAIDNSGATTIQADAVTVAKTDFVITAVKPSDETVSSDTMQDDDDLSVTLEASSIYAFECVLINTAGAWDIVKIEFIEPDGTFDISMRQTYLGGAAFETLLQINESSGVKNVQCAGGVVNNLTFHGVICTGGSGGTFKLQWAPEHDTQSWTIQKGSYFLLHKLA